MHARCPVRLTGGRDVEQRQAGLRPMPRQPDRLRRAPRARDRFRRARMLTASFPPSLSGYRRATPARCNVERAVHASRSPNNNFSRRSDITAPGNARICTHAAFATLTPPEARFVYAYALNHRPGIALPTPTRRAAAPRQAADPSAPAHWPPPARGPCRTRRRADRSSSRPRADPRRRYRER